MGILEKAKEKLRLGQPDPAATEDEQKLVSHVKSKVDEIRASANRVAHEGNWMTNSAYLVGIDGVAFNSQTRTLQPVNRTAGYIRKNRLHVNKILPTIQNRLARLCKNPPRYEVLPNSPAVEDKEAARFSKQVLTALWDKLKLDEKRIPLLMWTQVCGHAYIKISWDLSAGELMTDPITGESDYQGDVTAEIISPFEIFPNPLAKTWEEVQNSWLVQCKVRTLDYFKTHYPEKGELVKEEEAWLLSVQYENRINSMNTRGPSQGSMQYNMKNAAIEMIKYEARSKEYPKGRMIVVANGVLLENKDLPIGEIPFAKYDDIVVGGKYYSEAIVTHLRPVQDQFNEVIRRRAEWTKKLLAGKYQAARGSGLHQEALNDESGEVVYYDVVPNAPNGVQAIQVPQIPQWAYQEEDRLDKFFNDISGISEVSRGTLPSASIPAIGMQLLTEQDDTRIGVMTEQHEHAFARVGSLILKYVEAYYKIKRKLKMVGRGLEYTVKEVSGDMLRGNTDVKVVRGSTKPGSKTLQTQEILNRFQLGLLGNPADPKTAERVNAMTEFGDTTEVFEDYGLDMAQIKRGIQKLEAGEDVQPHEMDNNALWVQELNRYRKSDKFEALDPAKQALLLHQIEVRLHQYMQVNNMIPPAPPALPPPAEAGAPPAPGLEPAPVPAAGAQPPQGVM